MKKNILNLLLIFVFALSAKAQISESSTEDVRKEEEIFVVVEQQAEYPDGDLALKDWILTHVQVPKSILRKKKSGESIVNFTIEKTGNIADVVIFKSFDETFDKELIRLMNIMQKWKPGKQNGRAAIAYYSIMVKFEKGKIIDIQKLYGQGK